MFSPASYSNDIAPSTMQHRIPSRSKTLPSATPVAAETTTQNGKPSAKDTATAPLPLRHHSTPSYSSQALQPYAGALLPSTWIAVPEVSGDGGATMLSSAVLDELTNIVQSAM